MGTVLEGIGQETVEGITRPIDVLVLQEQDQLSTTTQAIVDVLNDIYGADTYARGQRSGRTNGGGRGAIVFNTQTVELISEASFGTLSRDAQARETMRYTLRPLGYGDDAQFAIYANHYKAGSTATDQTRRNVEATAVRMNADALFEQGEIQHMIFAGDFNIRGCEEAMFQTLIAPGSAQAIDPMQNEDVDCQWHNNESFKLLHTQSPADALADGFLAKGGVDDRFDFQLVTKAMLDGAGLNLIPGTYRTFGNNGTHSLNRSINDIQNTGASRSVLNALALTSDHLPVVADYQLPAWMRVSVGEIPDRIIQNTDVAVLVEVSNVAPVDTLKGADELDFAATLEIDSADNAQRLEGEVLSLASQSVEFAIPTDELRSRVYRLRVDSDSPGVVDGTMQTSGLYTVVAPSIASLSSEELVTNTEVDLGFVAIGDQITFSTTLYNLAAASQSADLEVGPFDNEGDTVFISSDPASIAPGGSAEVDFRFQSQTIGDMQTPLAVLVSDDRSIHGAIENTLELTLFASIALPGDADGNGTVEFSDFLSLSRNFGREPADWGEGDFDRDGSVGFSDFLRLSRNFGRTTKAFSVPEPSQSAWLLVVLWLRHGRRGRWRRDCSRRKAVRRQNAMRSDGDLDSHA